MRHPAALPAVALAGILSVAVPAARAQNYQVEDSTFVPRAARPALADTHPVVLIDEAHRNHFTMGGRYRALAALLASDGARVMPGRQPFSRPLLATCRVLIVADALGASAVNDPRAREPAFTGEECDVVRDWVAQGGALLLIADHAPFASSMDSLARRLGVDMGKGYTYDDRHVDPESGNAGCVLFTRDKDLLGDHPITRGRDSSERIARVATFTGQSLEGPPGSVALLRLSESAVDIPFTPDARRTSTTQLPKSADIPPDLVARGAVPAYGRAQAIAFKLGKGRVVVLGDAAMFGAQLVLGQQAKRMGKDALRLGLNRDDLDNEQLALNVVRWLAGALN